MAGADELEGFLSMVPGEALGFSLEETAIKMPSLSMRNVSAVCSGRQLALTGIG